MKPLAIRILYFAVLAAWFAVSSAAAAEKPQYGGFSPDADGHQAYFERSRALYNDDVPGNLLKLALRRSDPGGAIQC